MVDAERCEHRDTVAAHGGSGNANSVCVAMAENNAGTQEGDQTSLRQDGNQLPPFTQEKVQWIDQLISARNEARWGGNQEENSSGTGHPAVSLSTVVSQGGE